MKKLLSFLLIFTTLAVFSSPVYAKEKVNESLKRIMGYKHKCNVTFYITDETAEGYPGKSFKAVMTNKKGTTKDEYTLNFLNSWGKNKTPKYTVKAPILYYVTFEGVMDGYKIVDTLDKTEDIKFKAASKGTADCRWSIVDDEEKAAVSDDKGSKETGKEKDSKKKEDSEEDELSKLAETLTADASVKNTEPKNMAANDSPSSEFNENDAKKVYEEFYNDVKYTKDNKEWDDAVFIQYQLFDTTYIEWYEKYVKGGTKEEFLKMSLFDRFIWSETYLRFAWGVNSGQFDTYYGNEKKFKSYITEDIVNIMRNAKDSEKAVNAYLKLANWQYEYVKKNGFPFNFINNKTYLDEIGEDEGESVENSDASKVSEVPEKSETLDSNGLSEKDKKEMEEAAKELIKDADSKTKEEVKKKGIWDDFFSILSANLLTIIIILVLSIILAVVVWRRRSLNMDDNSSDSSIDNTHDK